MFIELGFWPPGWDLGLQVGIWATRQELGLGFKSKGGRTEKKEEKEKEEKIPHICEMHRSSTPLVPLPKSKLHLFVSVSHPNNEKNIA